MSANTELIAEARRISGSRSSLRDRAIKGLADALQAAEVELTRRDTVIAAVRREMEHAEVNDHRLAPGLEHPAPLAVRVDYLEAALAAAPVSLEAAKAETTTEWVETTEYAYGHLDAPDTIVATGEDIDDRGSAECNAEEFWAQVLERTVRRSEWRPVETEGAS